MSSQQLERRGMTLMVLMVVVLVSAAVYLMWARGAFEKSQPLYLLADDSSGISTGMDLTFSGFPIGRVRHIELTGDGQVLIRVNVAVKDAHWLRRSSVFTLERGIVGGARLKAYTGMLDDAPLEVGARRTILRGDVSEEIPRMVADARDALQNIVALTSPRSALNGTLEGLSDLTARINSSEGGLMAALTGNAEDARRVSRLLEQGDSVLAQVRQLLGTLDQTAAQARQEILGDRGLVSDARALSQDVSALLVQLQDSMRTLQAVLENVQQISADVRPATQDLDDLRTDLESSLGKMDALMTEIGGKWPFAPGRSQLELP